ncbi:tripartite motif-containing protein 2-like [Daphnia pulex]|uniref:tripartite motif-containing protein 2-like n=1 Tax=Daphnia pulex TaxID=6669 RepID=UPI001EDF1037|nr:tripartite motif-containing protein 2-like [Daphnia pulex]
MATGGSNEDDYLSTCGICFIKYDLLMNRPKVLPCSHTYCFTCIQVMIGSGNPLKCPMCRKTAVGIDKVESLPNNVHAEHNILLNKKLEKAEAEAKLSSKLLDAYLKSNKSECQVFVVTDDHEPKVLSINASKEVVNHFHHTSVKIPDTEKPAKLRIFNFMVKVNDIPAFPLLMTSLVNILKAQNPDVVFLYNVEPATLDRLKKSLPNFRFIYKFNYLEMSVTLLNTSVSYDSYEVVQLPQEDITDCYNYNYNLLKVDAHVGSLKLKLINAEIDMYASDMWRENFTKLMLDELGKASDATANIILRMGGRCDNKDWDTYTRDVGLAHRTVDVWEACKKPGMCNLIWRYDNMTETDVLEYKDFNGKMPYIDRYLFSRVYLRPANTVIAQPKFYGEIEFLNITPASHSAILFDFDISSTFCLS